MSHPVRRLVAGAGVSIAVIVGGLAGPAPLANAADAAPTCDQTALDAAVVTAATNARAAQKAYTVYTHTSMKSLAAQLKAERVRKIAEVGAKSHAAPKTHKNRHGARIKRISKHLLLKVVKAERARLKAAWDAAKKDLRAARAAAEACQAASAPAPVDEPGQP